MDREASLCLHHACSVCNLEEVEVVALVVLRWNAFAVCMDGRLDGCMNESHE